MIHYHGLPITPSAAAVMAIRVGHAFVSYAHSDQLNLAVDQCQSFAIDNGAFSAWKSGNPIRDWSGFYEWATMCHKFPSCDFAVIPDDIDGTEEDNDALVNEWPLPKWFGAPVWHMHESLERLYRLATSFPMICLGSSKEYAVVGTVSWWRRMTEVLKVVCNSDGVPFVRLHGLRMLDCKVFTKLPLRSADSTNIGRNIGIDKNWNGTYTPPNKETRALVLRNRIESWNSPVRCDFSIQELNNSQGLLQW